ncbi:MAG: XapX domain-containing protein [Verrucomicrobiales bacterium]
MPKSNKRKPMSAVLLALLAGVVVGILFSAIKLPLPAPPALAGVMGIAGIYLGGETWKFFAGLLTG